MEERPRLTALEIEEQLLLELQRLPSLRENSIREGSPIQRPEGLVMGAGQNRA